MGNCEYVQMEALAPCNPARVFPVERLITGIDIALQIAEQAGNEGDVERCRQALAEGMEQTHVAMIYRGELHLVHIDGEEAEEAEAVGGGRLEGKEDVDA